MVSTFCSVEVSTCTSNSSLSDSDAIFVGESSSLEMLVNPVRFNASISEEEEEQAST